MKKEINGVVYQSHEEYLAVEYEKENTFVFEPEKIVEFKDTTSTPIPVPIPRKTPSKRRKLTKEERTLCRNLIKNKGAYKGLEVDDKYIWGIGKYAITLVDEIHTPEGHHSNSWTFSGEKEFHNYFRKINKPSNYDDGVEIAKKIVRKYGKRGEKWE